MNDSTGILVVTGGGRGIGAASARLASEQGYQVCINYKSDQVSAEKLGKEIGALVVQADISIEEDVHKLFKTIDDQLGPITALVNNAGIPGPRLAVSEISKDIIETILILMLSVHFYVPKKPSIAWR